MKSFLFLSVGLFLIIFISGCVPGLFSLGGYDYEIAMPTIALTDISKTLAYAYIGVEAGQLFVPQADTSNPSLEVLIGVATTERPTVVKDLAVYAISVKDMAQEADPQIITNLSIPLETRPVKIMRGPDLDAKFGLFFNNGTSLNIRPKEALDTPILGQEDLLKLPRIKGIVARVVCEAEPVIRGDLFSVKREVMSIAKFPIQVITTEVAVQINQVDLVVKAANFLWLGPGDLFPNTVIERDDQALITPQDGVKFLVQNVTINTETEILAPPKNMSLPGIDFLLANKLGEIDISFQDKEYTLKQPGNTPQKDQPKLIPYIWAGIKSN